MLEPRVSVTNVAITEGPRLSADGPINGLLGRMFVEIETWGKGTMSVCDQTVLNIDNVVKLGGVMITAAGKALDASTRVDKPVGEEVGVREV